MSFDNTECPCGGKKERETLICPACVEAISESDHRFDLNHYRDETFPVSSRRGMAIRVLSAARRRTGQRPLALQFTA